MCVVSTLLFFSDLLKMMAYLYKFLCYFSYSLVHTDKNTLQVGWCIFHF